MKSREISKHKWLSKCKKLYHAQGFNRFFDSITSFINTFNFTKMYKKTTKFQTTESERLDKKSANRKIRHNKNYDLV